MLQHFAFISASLPEFKRLIIQTPIERSLLLDFLACVIFLKIRPEEKSCASLKLDLIAVFCFQSVDQPRLDAKTS